MKVYTIDELKEILRAHTEGERADLSYADLSNADLRNADLSEANLRNADLSKTCLSLDLHAIARRFTKECPPLRTGGRIVFRTQSSVHVGNTNYLPGSTYVAPNLSWSSETECHPGIYAASLEWMKKNYPEFALVRCYVRDGDWTITAKGAIRCKRIRVLSTVEVKP